MTGPSYTSVPIVPTQFRKSMSRFPNGDLGDFLVLLLCDFAHLCTSNIQFIFKVACKPVSPIHETNYMVWKNGVHWTSNVQTSKYAKISPRRNINIYSKPNFQSHITCCEIFKNNIPPIHPQVWKRDTANQNMSEVVEAEIVRRLHVEKYVKILYPRIRT